MTLHPADNKTLEKWFVKLQTLEAGSEEYISLRNKIYTYIYHKLMDLLRTKVGQWKRKYGLDEEDSISIFHDSLLQCVEKYRPNRNKFITYFWQACDNTAKNYYKKYRCQRRIPMANIFNVDFDELNNQADIISTNARVVNESMEENQQWCKLTDQLRNLYETDQYKQEITQLVQDNIISLLPCLSESEAKVFEKVIEGHSMSTISKLLNMRVQQVGLCISKIQQKASKVV